MAHVSALMIVDPEQGKVVWAHTGDFKGQHDPTIVADGRILLFDNGMTPWGVTAVVDRVVWEFYNPHRAGEHNEFVATLFELVRLPPEFPTSWISASLGARSAIR
jgi:hypothetical protein